MPDPVFLAKFAEQRQTRLPDQLDVSLPNANTGGDPVFQQAFAEQVERGQVLSAAMANSDQIDEKYFTGLASSAISSFGELFGIDPSLEAERFRVQNPVSGFASQLVGPLGAFGAAYKISKLPKMATALDATVTRLGLDAAAQPVLAGAAREVARYAPLELARLGVGLATTDDWEDYGNLLADVGISTAFTGAFGGVGGFFRAGGTRIPEQGRVAGADVGLLPTFEYRLGLNPNAQVTGDLSFKQTMHNLKQEALGGVPIAAKQKGEKQLYVNGLDDGSPSTEGMLNQLFNPQQATLSEKSLAKRPYDIRTFVEDGANNTRTLNSGEQDELVKLAGFRNSDEFAASMVYPRAIKVNNDRSAGWLGKELDVANSGGFQQIEDGVLMGKEADGLFVVMKRLKQGNVENPNAKPFARMKVEPDVKQMKLAEGKEYLNQMKAKALKDPSLNSMVKRLEKAYENNAVKRFGGQKVGQDDVWLLGKTDKPNMFAPKEHNILKNTMESWSRLREPFRVAAANDAFNGNMNRILDAVSPQDWAAMASVRKRTWVNDMAGKLKRKIGEETGLAGQQGTRDAAEWLYDVLKPTLYKEQADPLFARLYGLLRGNMDFADNQLNKIMGGQVRFNSSPAAAMRGDVRFESFGGNRPVRDIWKDLDDDELQLVVKAAQTQTPADDLAKLSNSGDISPKAIAAVQELQKVNEKLMNELVMPVLNQAGLGGNIKLLEGYILPRVFKGDWMAEVVDEAGNIKWLAAGKTPKMAQREADAVVEAAADKGLIYKRKKAESLSFDKDVDNLREISNMIDLGMGQDKAAQEVVQNAMRKLDSTKSLAGSTSLNPRTPAKLGRTRTGVAGSPDIANYTVDDVVEATTNHYRQLLRFAGYHSWKSRWMPFAQSTLKKSNPTMFQDLERKAGQFLGVEGQITNTLNKTLSPVLGNLLGGKAATKIAQETNRLMYAWNLGIVNPTFALLNLLTPLQTVAPWVSFVHSAPKEDVAKMMQFMPRYGSDGLPRGQMGVMHPMKVLGEATKQMKNPEPQLKQMLEEAVSDGTLSPQLYNEWVGSSAEAVQTLRGAFKEKGAWEFIKKTSTWMAEKSENYSRMMAFNSAYLVGKNSFGLSGDALYRFAKRGTQMTMYGYGVVDRARAMTGPVGSMFGLFKNWQFHFLGSMAQYAGLGMRDGIWAPMLWQGGAALALGGLGATPLKLAADGLAKWHSDSPSSFHWLQENWHEGADEIYFGLPSLLGASLQSSAAVPGTDVRNEVANMANFVFLERAKQAAVAMGEASDHWDVTGRNPLKNDNIRDKLIGALAPRAVFRAFSAMEDEQIKSMRSGLPIRHDVPISTRALHGLGLNQVDVERWQIAGRELFKDQEKLRTQVQAFGKDYAEAQMAGDFHRMKLILDQVVGMGIPVSSVMSSARTRQRREAGTPLDRYDSTKVQSYVDALEGR